METRKYPVRIRAAMACRIVNLDRVRFNDAVASGTYPCAPSTRSGAARIFTADEMVPLYFFARLTEFGLPASLAGRMACEMGDRARTDDAEPASRIIFVKGAGGASFMVPNVSKRPADGVIVTNYDPEHETPTEGKPNGWHYPGVGRVIFTMEFYVKHVRELLADQIAYEMSILGEDEDEKLL